MLLSYKTGCPFASYVDFSALYLLALVGSRSDEYLIDQLNTKQILAVRCSFFLTFEGESFIL